MGWAESGQGGKRAWGRSWAPARKLGTREQENWGSGVEPTPPLVFAICARPSLIYSFNPDKDHIGGTIIVPITDEAGTEWVSCLRSHS